MRIITMGVLLAVSAGAGASVDASQAGPPPANQELIAAPRGALSHAGDVLFMGDDRPDAIALEADKFSIISLVPLAPLAARYFGWGGSWNCDGYFDGDIAELVIFDHALNDAERRKTEEYLSQKYAVPLLDH